MSEINYSFIIPHKNTPDLLQKCLDSIPRRDDIQIIVVDDNSDAGMVDFSHFPGVDDPAVNVIMTKEGRGAGYARNVGINHADGKWLIFADADDFFTPALEAFIDSHVCSDADVVVWKTCCIDLDTGKPGKRGENINRFADEVINSGQTENILLISTPVKGMYSGRLIRENGIRFNECRWGNDVVFSSRIAVAARKVEVYDNVVYCISSHSSFGLKSNPSLESVLTRFRQEAESIRLTRTRYAHNENIHSWFFISWFSVYKFNKWSGILCLPSAVLSDGVHFIRQACRAIFS